MNTSCRLSLHQCSDSRNVHHIQAWTLVPAQLSFPKGTKSGSSFQIRASMSQLPGQLEPFSDQLAAPSSASSAHTCPHLPLNAPSRPHPIDLHRSPCWTVLQHLSPMDRGKCAPSLCITHRYVIHSTYVCVQKPHAHLFMNAHLCVYTCMLEQCRNSAQSPTQRARDCTKPSLSPQD